MRYLGVAVLCGLLASSARAAAADPKPEHAPPPRIDSVDVELAEQLLTKLDYDRAFAEAEKIVGAHDLGHAELLRGYRVLAVTSAILDKGELAKSAFFRLLVLDPDFAVDPNLGPKVSLPFVEARGQFRSLPTRPGVELVAEVRLDGGRLRVTTRDPTHAVKNVVVGHRWAGGDFALTQVGPGSARVDVGNTTSSRARLDFYALALDERNNVVFEAGTADAPRSVFVEAPDRIVVKSAPQRRSFVSSPLFWVASGAALVGLAAAGFFVFRPDGPPTRASLAPTIRCGDDFCQ